MKWNSIVKGLAPMPEDSSSGDLISANLHGELGEASEANRALRGDVGSNCVWRNEQRETVRVGQVGQQLLIIYKKGVERNHSQ